MKTPLSRLLGVSLALAACFIAGLAAHQLASFDSPPRPSTAISFSTPFVVGLPALHLFFLP